MSTRRNFKWRRCFPGIAVLALALAFFAWLHFSRRPAGGGTGAGGVVPALKNLKIPAEPDAGALDEELARALGHGKRTAPLERLDLIRDLAGAGELDGPEYDALLRALLERRRPGVDPGWHSEYVHSLSLILQEQPDVRERFARALATVARDGARDEVVRDYALQHLRQVWDRAAGDETLRASIVTTFRELAAEESPVSASSLLSLHLLGTPAGGEAGEVSAADGGEPSLHLPDTEIEPLVEDILRQPPADASIRARMTAARIAGDRRLAGCRDGLLAAAGDEGEHALVRMAAVHALGRIGDPGDLAALSSLSPGDERIAGAIRHTLAAGTSR